MKDNIKFEYSAGGVVVNDNKEVLLIKTKNLKNETVITFPKGHIEKNETSQEAAVREVKEETGVEASIVKKIKDVEYWFVHQGQKIHKKVTWYLMKPVKIDKVKNIEVEEVFWYDINKVEEMLSYKSDKELIAEVKKMI
jgi:8-oxo-dGTP diphosphatase